MSDPKDQQLNIRMDTKMADALRKEASARRLSPSSLARMAVAQWLQRRGHLSPTPPPNERN